MRDLHIWARLCSPIPIVSPLRWNQHELDHLSQPGYSMVTGTWEFYSQQRVLLGNREPRGALYHGDTGLYSCSLGWRSLSWLITFVKAYIIYLCRAKYAGRREAKAIGVIHVCGSTLLKLPRSLHPPWSPILFPCKCSARSKIFPECHHISFQQAWRCVASTSVDGACSNRNCRHRIWWRWRASTRRLLGRSRSIWFRKKSNSNLQAQ